MSDEPFVFVGSSDGWLRAFRGDPCSAQGVSAGQMKLNSLSFFAVGPRLFGVRLPLFVSSKNRLQALLYDPHAQKFEVLAEVETEGSGTHLAVEQSGELTRVYLAHYHEDCVSAFCFSVGEGFGSESIVRPGHQPHQSNPRDGFLYVPCLGSDSIYQYAVFERPGRRQLELQPLDPQATSVPGGPRHMAFAEDGEEACVIGELSSRLEFLKLEGGGRIVRRVEESTPTHPDGGAHWSSDVAYQGQTLIFALNRDPSELIAFRRSGSFPLSEVQRVGLSAPARSMCLDPRAGFIVVGGDDGILYTVVLEGAFERKVFARALGAIRHACVAYA